MPNMLVSRTWPIEVHKIEDVPQAFQDYFSVYSEEEFPYLIFQPAERTFSIKRHAKIICIMDEEIRIYEKEKRQVIETLIKVKDVNYFEWGSILLNSWITVNYFDGSRNVRYTLTFNSTSDPLYKHVAEKFRHLENNIENKAAATLEEEKFGFLMMQNFKFMNLGKQSIEAGEEVRQILYQPEIKERYLKLFGKQYYKTVFKSSLSILTDSELIVIREPEGTRVRHGGVKWYIPLNKIKQMHLSLQKDIKKWILNIEFFEDSYLRLELEDSKYAETQNLLERFKKQASYAGA